MDTLTLKKDIDLMEHTQHNAAHFITGDYRSAIPSSITKFLKKM